MAFMGIDCKKMANYSVEQLEFLRDRLYCLHIGRFVQRFNDLHTEATLDLESVVEYFFFVDVSTLSDCRPLP